MKNKSKTKLRKIYSDSRVEQFTDDRGTVIQVNVRPEKHTDVILHVRKKP